MNYNFNVFEILIKRKPKKFDISLFTKYDEHSQFIILSNDKLMGITMFNGILYVKVDKRIAADRSVN